MIASVWNWMLMGPELWDISSVSSRRVKNGCNANLKIEKSAEKIPKPIVIHLSLKIRKRITVTIHTKTIVRTDLRTRGYIAMCVPLYVKYNTKRNFMSGSGCEIRSIIPPPKAPLCITLRFYKHAPLARTHAFTTTNAQWSPYRTTSFRALSSISTSLWIVRSPYKRILQ